MKCAECGKEMPDGPMYIKVEWVDGQERAVTPAVGWCSNACATQEMREMLGHGAES